MPAPTASSAGYTAGFGVVGCEPNRVPVRLSGLVLEWSCALWSDVHEEASVKPGARRLRDFPDIHSASSAKAERHERVCGRSHSTPRRRIAPRRTSGCDLSPALDLDLDSLLPAGPMCAGPC